MSVAKHIGWFKGNFGTRVNEAVKGTPFTLDMIAAIAFQETGSIWGPLAKKGLPVSKILKLCTGDTLDYPTRKSAWPRNRAALEKHPQGKAMFKIARAALLAMSKHVPGYKGVAANPNKFCHGFGIFQYDIQFFKSVDPNYFLNKDYEIFEKSLAKCISELKSKQKRIGYGAKTRLSDLEMAAVAIAYNRGSYNKNKGLKQGHYDKRSKKYYGEYFYQYLKIAKSVRFEGVKVGPDETFPRPTPIAATGKTYRVETLSSPLRLRSKPLIDKNNPNKYRIGSLPRHSLVKAVSEKPTNGFLEVEASVQGAFLRGFAAAHLLKPVAESIKVMRENPKPPKAPVALPGSPKAPNDFVLPEVHLKRRAGLVTRRTNEPDHAGAYPLNEKTMPTRMLSGSQAVRAQSIHKIVAWLDCEKPAHKRYQKKPGITCCNLYAHDLCTRAGVYLPRVWWTSRAIEQLRKGKAVEPSYDHTVIEMRANALYRWLRDYGSDYGWRQTGNATTLQEFANAGGVGLICAARVNENRSGHITVVVPETSKHLAVRSGSDAVLQPLQSQAGSTNFRYGPGGSDWWLGKKFKAWGFWVHE